MNNKNLKIYHFDNKKWLNNIYFIGFLAIYVSFLVYITSIINISEDEAYTLNTTSRNFWDVIHQAYNFEAQPPFYFIVLSLWRKIADGIFFAKLFSIICIGISAYYFYQLTFFFSRKNVSRWMTVVFLLNPFTVWAALELRLYSLLFLLSTSSIYFFLKFYYEHKKYSLLRFAIICLFGIYTQYFFSFLVISFGVIILISKQWKKFVRYAIYLLPVILLTIPNLLFIPSQIDQQKSIRLEHMPLSVVHDIVFSPRNLILGIDSVTEVWLNRILRLIIYSAALIAYFKYYKERLPYSKKILSRYNLVLFSIAFLLILFCIAFVLTNVGFAAKYLTVAFPLFITTLSIFSIYGQSLRNVIYGFISVYFIILLIVEYQHPVKTYDYRSVANFIESIERPNEPILVYRPAISTPFRYCYHGNNSITPLPYPVNFDSSYLISIKDTNQLKQSMNPVTEHCKSYIFLSDTTKYEGLQNMNRKMISNYLDEHYNLVLDTFLIGYGKEKSLRIRRFENN